MPRPAAAPLTPRQAIARGQRLIEESKRARAAAEAEAARVEAERIAALLSWRAPAAVETTVRRVSRPPARWRRVWVRPVAALDLIEVAFWDGVAHGVESERNAAGWSRAAEGGSATGAEIGADPSTEAEPVGAGGDDQSAIGMPMAQQNQAVKVMIKGGAGTHLIADLREGQCRFACTPDHARPEDHRFCGEPVASLRGKPTSWCREHLARVCGAPGRTAGGMSVTEAARGLNRAESRQGERAA